MKCELNDINIVEYNNHPIDSALYDHAKTYMLSEDINESQKNSHRIVDLYGINSYCDRKIIIITIKNET